ncbi:hypothetical protein GGH93_001320 [Coemansia aciculifera]|nr:hypothetical protein GGH93_001320 [Coemansia aciculifera]
MRLEHMLGKAKHISGLYTMLDSALSTAKVINLQGSDEETVLARLLQDIGCFCQPVEEWSGNNQASYQLFDAAGKPTIVDYGRLGADYLRMLKLSKKICELVEPDILAMRHLMTIEPEHLQIYKDSPLISIWSVPLSDEEMGKYEADPLFKDKLQLRTWKAGIYTINDDSPALSTYREMAIRNMTI